MGTSLNDARRVVLVVGATSENNLETLSSFRDELLIAGPIALILAIGLTLWVTRGISRRVGNVASAATTLAGGDLSSRAEAKGCHPWPGPAPRGKHWRSRTAARQQSTSKANQRSRSSVAF